MLDHSANAGRHALSDRGNDLYETPPEVTRALLKCEPLPKYIWECACGKGSISRVLLAAGHKVCNSDLVEYGHGYHGIDFLLERKMPEHCTAIVTNPPFKLATEFVRHALHLCPGKVVMLLRLAFLEGVGRSDILDGGKLARVHVFKNRLPMMHRDGWQGPRATSSTAFAWFCWESNHVGPASISRVSWE